MFSEERSVFSTHENVVNVNWIMLIHVNCVEIDFWGNFNWIFYYPHSRWADLEYNSAAFIGPADLWISTRHFMCTYDIVLIRAEIIIFDVKSNSHNSVEG